MNKCKILKGLSLPLFFFSLNGYANDLEERKYSTIGFTEPKKQITISTQVDGVISKLNVNKGSVFELGDTLIKIEGDKSNPSLSRLNAQLELAIKDKESKERLFNNNHISEIEYLASVVELENMREQYDRGLYIESNKEIKAPFNGKVREIITNEYENVTRNQDILSIYSNDHIELYSYIYDMDNLCIDECYIYAEYNGKILGPYDISYTLVDLEQGFGVSRVGTYVKEDIPYGVSLNFYLYGK